MVMCASVVGYEGDRLVVLDKNTQQEVIVHTRRRSLCKGDNIKIVYNGIMALSLPPQITAQRIIKLS